MNTQLALVYEPRARRRDPDTSHAAAKAQSPSVLEASILFAFAAFGPMTDDELCAHFADRHEPTVKTARSRASKRGELVDSGLRRPSRRGRDQIVWQSCGG